MPRCRLSRYAPALLALSCVAQAHASFEGELAALLAGTEPQVRVAGEVLWSTPFLRELYAEASSEPLWNERRLAALRAAIAQPWPRCGRTGGTITRWSRRSPRTARMHLDATLVAAVEAFQRRHGLQVDGIVGRATLAALNVPVAARIAQLRINLERLRWVFRDRAEEFVAVNIAAFQAVYVVQDEVRWRGRAVVGQPFRQTPIFKAELTHLVLNPTWTVPPTILRKDILPKLRQDVGYLRQRKLRVFDREGRSVDASMVDWQSVSVARFPYLLRQDAGPDNALGRIKFMFPNAHAVYLHDTPARALFDQAERTFSSGCIRIEDPLGLAELLLDEPQHWNRAGLAAALASGRTRRVDLPRTVPVMLLYLTAFPGSDGALNFRRDVYARDAAVLAALDGPLQWAVPVPREQDGGDGEGER